MDIDAIYPFLVPVFLLVLSGVILSFLLLFAEKKILNYGLCNIDINDGKKEFEIDGGGFLLSSLTANDVYIPSACGGRGSCAYCKVEVIDGAGFMSPVEEGLLLPDEITKNVRLSCQVKIRENISIRIPDELLKVKKYSGILLKKTRLTYDIVGLDIKVLGPKTISFEAGQYIQLESNKYRGKESVIRAYSISSLPSEKDTISLMIRKVPDGICTTWVFEYLNESQKVSFSGPYGDFVLSSTNKPIIFIAGGSGMAPIWSILSYMIDNEIKRKCIYFFGALTRKDLFYENRLEKLSRELDWFDFVPALSSEPKDSKWSGERGLITDVVKRYVPDSSNYEAYLCGSPGMINACVTVLLEGGIAADNIFYDKF